MCAQAFFVLLLVRLEVWALLLSLHKLGIQECQIKGLCHGSMVFTLNKELQGSPQRPVSFPICPQPC